MKLSPGIQYFLIPNLGAIFAPPLILIAANYALVHLFNFDSLPAWLRISFLLLSWPTVFAISLIYKHVRDIRRAAAMGAVLAPSAPYRLPGGIDLLVQLLHEANSGYLAEFAERLSKEVGMTWVTTVFWQPKIFTLEPEHIKLVLATEFNNYEKGPVQRDQLRSMLGTGVFNSDGEMWKFHRTMTRPFFSKDRISHFDLFGRHSDAAIKSMKARFAEGAAIDFQDLVSRFTLDSATEFLFGHCVHSLNAGLPYPASHPLHTADTGDADRFAKSFSAAQEALAIRTRFGGGWALRELFSDSTTSYMKEINRFIDPILVDAIAKRKEEVESGMSMDKKDVSDEDTLLSYLIRHTQDPRILKDETLNIMIAGRDTTAATLTFLFYMLSQHPEVLKRLRNEILEVVGPSRYPTYDDLREMKYLRAVLNETLRLFPPVPFDARANINETTLPPNVPGGRPFYVPSNTLVIYSVFLMHRRTDLWGLDALEFDPDRFLDERLHKYLTPHPFIFLPFNAGPRICLGQQFAYNESLFMAIRLLQSFDTVSLAREAQPVDSLPPAEWVQGTGRKKIEKIVPKSHLTMYVKGGLWLRLGEVNDDKSESG